MCAQGCAAAGHSVANVQGCNVSLCLLRDALNAAVWNMFYITLTQILCNLMVHDREQNCRNWK